MWNALGNCYSKLNKVNESTKSYERADQCKDKECIALHSLAKLYDLMGEKKKAAQCFEKNYQRKDEDTVFDKEWAESVLYVALFEFGRQNYETASELARRLIDFNGSERDQANSLLIEINVIQNQQQKGHPFDTPNNQIFSSNQVFVSTNLNGQPNTSNSHLNQFF